LILVFRIFVDVVLRKGIQHFKPQRTGDHPCPLTIMSVISQSNERDFTIKWAWFHNQTKINWF